MLWRRRTGHRGQQVRRQHVKGWCELGRIGSWWFSPFRPTATSSSRLGASNNKRFPLLRSLGSPRSRCRQIPFLVRTRFLIYKWLPSHGREQKARGTPGERKLFCLFLETLTPFIRASLSGPNLLPPLNTITLRVRISACIFRGHKHSVHGSRARR